MADASYFEELYQALLQSSWTAPVKGLDTTVIKSRKEELFKAFWQRTKEVE
jgi:hypothetical protein